MAIALNPCYQGDLKWSVYLQHSGITCQQKKLLISLFFRTLAGEMESLPPHRPENTII